MPKPETFGMTVRRLRLAAGLRQSDVAVLVGRDHNTVSRWELGLLAPEPLVQEAAIARLRAAPKERKADE